MLGGVTADAMLIAASYGAGAAIGAGAKMLTPKFNFVSKAKLNNHFNQHGAGMGYKTKAGYVRGANSVIKKGTYIESLNGYVLRTSIGSGNNVLFVGMNRAGTAITTFHIKSIAKLLRML
jgi:hypothetical protein